MCDVESVVMDGLLIADEDDEDDGVVIKGFI